MARRIFDSLVAGCVFHFLQSCRRVCPLLCITDEEQISFMHFCKRIIKIDQLTTVEGVKQLWHSFEVAFPGGKAWFDFWVRQRDGKYLAMVFEACSKVKNLDSLPLTTNHVEVNNATLGRISREGSLGEMTRAQFGKDRKIFDELYARSVSIDPSYTIKNLNERLQRRRNYSRKNDGRAPDTRKSIKTSTPRMNSLYQILDTLITIEQKGLSLSTLTSDEITETSDQNSTNVHEDDSQQKQPSEYRLFQAIQNGEVQLGDECYICGRGGALILCDSDSCRNVCHHVVLLDYLMSQKGSGFVLLVMLLK